MQSYGSADAEFAREVMDMYFEYSNMNARPRTWEQEVAMVRWLYAQEHSFTFFINGSKEGKKFNSVQEWADSITPEMKANFEHCQLIITNVMPFREESRVQFFGYQLQGGKVVAQAHCKILLVREDGRLKYKHNDIYYWFS